LVGREHVAGPYRLRDPGYAWVGVRRQLGFTTGRRRIDEARPYCRHPRSPAPVLSLRSYAAHPLLDGGFRGAVDSVTRVGDARRSLRHLNQADVHTIFDRWRRGA
jgi:hypothetical protein